MTNGRIEKEERGPVRGSPKSEKNETGGKAHEARGGGTSLIGKRSTLHLSHVGREALRRGKKVGMFERRSAAKVAKTLSRTQGKRGAINKKIRGGHNEKEKKTEQENEAKRVA